MGEGGGGSGAARVPLALCAAPLQCVWYAAAGSTLPYNSTCQPLAPKHTHTHTHTTHTHSHTHASPPLLSLTLQMNVFEDRLPGRAIVISVIDNLVKGASGQAMQNLNLVMGYDEGTALQQLAMFP